MYSKTERTQFYIFLLIAYGVTFVMGALMWYGNEKGIDVSAFPNAQMLYPAAGVMLAYLLTGRTSETAQGFQSGEGKITRGFYVVFLLLTAIMVMISVLSLRIVDFLEIAEQRISIWTLAVQYILIVGSIACWITLGVAGKERRENCGLRWENGRSSLFCILLFFVLYTLRMSVSYGISGQISVLADLAKNPVTWINFISLAINFFFVFAAFFGEEYGWRYYMQPYLQKKFGLRGGVLVLGIVWGLWHLPVDFFYYTTPDMGLIAAVSQQITCISLGIFFAYAYMKTDNIWVPVILHYLNNNLVPIFSGDYSVDVLQNQQLSWGQIPVAFVMNAVFFGWFLLAKPFRKKEKE